MSDLISSSGSSGSSGSSSASSSVVFTELGGRLILTFPSELTAERSRQIELDVLRRISRQSFAALIFDLSALTLIDLEEWRWLRKTSQEASLLGAQVWLVGIRASIIATLVTLNAELEGVRYALGVKEALDETSVS